MRFADFTSISRSLTLAEPTNITHELLEAGIELLTRRLPPRHLPVRLLGFGVQRFADAAHSQQQLFAQPKRERLQALDRVTGQITAKFGKSALHRGTRPNKPGQGT